VDEFSKSFNLEKTSVLEYWNSGRESVKKRLAYSTSQHSRLLYVQEMLRNLGFSSNQTLALKLENIYWSRYFTQMKPIKDAENFLHVLRNLKIPIILVTDLDSRIQLKKLLYLGWENYFDDILTSEYLGSDKKFGNNFTYALDEMDMQYKKNVWFIGDQPTDLPNIKDLIQSDYIINGETFQIKIGHETTKFYTNLIKILNKVV
jgi:putative hydrolase of the HAD superfamily